MREREREREREGEGERERERERWRERGRGRGREGEDSGIHRSLCIFHGPEGPTIHHREACKDIRDAYCF